MNCSGIDAQTGAAVEVEFDRVIRATEPLICPPRDLPLLAPGFIDLQVNGFAGTDYNSPGSSHEAIGESLRAMFRTGDRYRAVSAADCKRVAKQVFDNTRRTVVHGAMIESS